MNTHTYMHPSIHPYIHTYICTYNPLQWGMQFLQTNLWLDHVGCDWGMRLSRVNGHLRVGQNLWGHILATRTHNIYIYLYYIPVLYIYIYMCVHNIWYCVQDGCLTIPASRVGCSSSQIIPDGMSARQPVLLPQQKPAGSPRRPGSVSADVLWKHGLWGEPSLNHM